MILTVYELSVIVRRSLLLHWLSWRSSIINCLSVHLLRISVGHTFMHFPQVLPMKLLITSHFTARRICIAQTMLYEGVCPFVCATVRHTRYWLTINGRMITHFSQPGTVVLCWYQLDLTLGITAWKAPIGLFGHCAQITQECHSSTYAEV